MPGTFSLGAKRLGKGMYLASSASHRPKVGEFPELGRGFRTDTPKNGKRSLHPFPPLSEANDLNFYFLKETKVLT